MHKLGAGRLLPVRGDGGCTLHFFKTFSVWGVFFRKGNVKTGVHIFKKISMKYGGRLKNLLSFCKIAGGA